MGLLREGALATLDAVENGTAVNISDVRGVYVSVTGTFVGTWAVQVSFNGGTSYVNFDTGTAAKLVGPLPRCGRVRGICSAFTSGQIDMNYGGEDVNR